MPNVPSTTSIGVVRATPDYANVNVSNATSPYDHVTLSSACPEPVEGSKGAPESRLSAESIASAVLFREILKPLAAGLGPVAEIALGEAADALCVRERR